jgi:hypothetical protein
MVFIVFIVTEHEDAGNFKVHELLTLLLRNQKLLLF